MNTRVKLGVNIDHVATLRQARRDIEPDPVAAARVAVSGGADMIVLHLRVDRRHMQDQDLSEICRLKIETHLEISSSPEMVAIAIKARPGSVCVVPERPGELTTEGGLDLGARHANGLAKAIERLKSEGIEVSLFIDPSAAGVRRAKALRADTVELCTTAYSQSKGRIKQKEELEKLTLAAYLAREMGLEVHAGHGLDYHNVRLVAQMPQLSALNIGFSIMARAMFVGLKTAVAEMKRLIS